ncbi:MAG: hypothetical protein ACOZCP_17520 [Pseudomonadota bacterium]
MNLRALIIAALAMFAASAWPHQVADPADELPLWQILAVAAAVLLGWAVAPLLRRLRRRRPRPVDDDPARQR